MPSTLAGTPAADRPTEAPIELEEYEVPNAGAPTPLDALRSDLAALAAEVAELREDLAGLRASLGD